MKRQAPVEEERSNRVSTAVPGSRGHPIRSHLACVERGNPDRWADCEEGRPPGGMGMIREANAGGRKATGNRDGMARFPLVVSANRPDRDACPGLKGR